MRKSKMFKNALLALGLAVSAALPLSGAWAHGGGAAQEFDTCRIDVGGHWVHFTAYQPQLSGMEEFCGTLPGPGLTNLVIDYEGKALRQMEVEFELTKEPEGTSLVKVPLAKHSNGVITTPYNVQEPGKYLAHITLVNEGQRIDAHLPIMVSSDRGTGGSNTLLIGGVILVALGYVLYLSNAGFKGMIDGIFKRAKDF